MNKIANNFVVRWWHWVGALVLGLGLVTGSQAQTPNPPSVEIEKVVQEIGSDIASAVASVTLSAITNRIDAVSIGNLVTSSVETESQVSLAGHDSIAGVLGYVEPKLQQGERLAVEELLRNTSFGVSLAALNGAKNTPISASATDDGEAVSGGSLSTLYFWGSTDYRNLDDEGALSWDGNLASFSLGADVIPTSGVLAGIAISRVSSDLDYRNTIDPNEQGSYRYKRIGIHPYMNWQRDDGASVWASVGIGKGDIEIELASGQLAKSDTKEYLLSSGMRRPILNDSNYRFSVKGDISTSQIGVLNGTTVKANQIANHTARSLLEVVRQQAIPTGRFGMLTPSVEGGIRYTGGDGDVGAGVEFGGGLNYNDPVKDLIIEGRSTLIVANEYEEYGGSVLFRKGAFRNLCLSLQPTWGNTDVDSEPLWTREGTGFDTVTATDPDLSVNAELSYAMFIPPVMNQPGSMTPYATYNMTPNSSVFNVGNRVKFGKNFGLEVGLHREDRATALPTHGVTLKGKLDF